MNDLLQAISFVLGIIIPCVAVGGILTGLNRSYQTQASIDLLALTNPQPPVWRIDRRRMAALFLGAIAYGVILYVIENSSTVAPNWNWVYSLPFVVPLFFGAVYGPWVGLFVGVAGELLSAVIGARVYGSSFTIQASGVVADAITGFIAGLSFAFTRGRFDNLRALIVVEIFGGIGVLLGDYLYAVFSQSQIFISIIVPDLLCSLILLPILLTLYDRSIFYES